MTRRLLLLVLAACAARTRTLPSEVTSSIPSVTLPPSPSPKDAGRAAPLVQEVKIGNIDPFSGQSTHAANTLLGSPIEIPRGGTLWAFGVIAVADKGAYPSIMMALYTDQNAGPHSLVAYTRPAQLTGGDQQIVPIEPIDLTAGAYWIMAVYDGVGSIGIDYSDATASVAHTSLGFGRPPPPVFPAPSIYSGQRFNYYVVMR